MRKLSPVRRIGKRNIKYRHGMNKHPLNYVINSIIGRCMNPNIKEYKNYGARGIDVFDEWVHDRKKFFKWAFKNGWEKGLHIDRVDNNQGYYPWNCRFVTVKVNAKNKRGTIFIEYKGVKKPLSEWCEILELCYSLVYSRFKMGWSTKEMFTLKSGELIHKNNGAKNKIKEYSSKRFRV